MKISSSHAADMSSTEANIESMNQTQDNEKDKTGEQKSSASLSMKADNKNGNKTFSYDGIRLFST